MKTLAGLLILFIFCGCSESQQADNEPAADMIERYNKPIDAAGAAADQVEQIQERQ